MPSASHWRVEADLPAPIHLPLALPFFLTAATSPYNPNPFFFPISTIAGASSSYPTLAPPNPSYPVGNPSISCSHGLPSASSTHSGINLVVSPSAQALPVELRPSRYLCSS